MRRRGLPRRFAGPIQGSLTQTFARSCSTRCEAKASRQRAPTSASPCFLLALLGKSPRFRQCNKKLGFAVNDKRISGLNRGGWRRHSDPPTWLDENLPLEQRRHLLDLALRAVGRFGQPGAAPNEPEGWPDPVPAQPGHQVGQSGRVSRPGNQVK